MRILVVDDDVDLAELIKTKLISEGHQVGVVHTGEGAFEKAKEFKPDIVLLDIMLPGVTGYQICRRIRKDPELYKTAIIILTALGEEPEMLHGLEQGADDYLVKPFKLERLMDKISSLGVLLASINARNQVTNFPGTDAIKREINHKLARGEQIAVVYINLVGFKPYCVSHGPDGQKKALIFLANLLVDLKKSLGLYECFMAHMGGEHFVVLLNASDYEKFCEALVTNFDQKKSQLYTPQEYSQGYIYAVDRNGAEVRCPLMALSVGVVHNLNRPFKNAKKMFEVLAQVRQKAQPIQGKSVYFVDRRHIDR
ncbi:MAG TPA: response regulator [Candidatus Hydrogenedens sp.]|nr:response regulator [Candidatus Hydrogenedens sp.]HOK08531.1 response regulator [Candidatus Hydrogenedens sp.]HOL19019.1 response regulator [Candidatus Hydrogenedens sp.]HPP57799.1 response regulator [Candidatus Hydrogenedens sp.]